MSDLESTRATGDAAAREADGRDVVKPLLVIGLVVAIVLAIVFFALWRRASRLEPSELTGALSDEASRVENRAEDVIDLLMNYDASNFEARSDQIRAVATGDFLEQYDDLVEQGLRKIVEEEGASSEGRIIRGPDVSFTNATQAVVLARVAQTTRSTADPQGRTFGYEFKLEMVKVGDEWKADDFEILAEASST